MTESIKKKVLLDTMKVPVEVAREVKIAAAEKGRFSYELVTEAWECYKTSLLHKAKEKRSEDVTTSKMDRPLFSTEAIIAQAAKLSEITRLAGEIQEFIVTPVSGAEPANTGGSSDDHHSNKRPTGANRPPGKVAGGR